jgi:hypothetical protein
MYSRKADPKIIKTHDKQPLQKSTQQMIVTDDIKMIITLGKQGTSAYNS